MTGKKISEKGRDIICVRLYRKWLKRAGETASARDGSWDGWKAGRWDSRKSRKLGRLKGCREEHAGTIRVLIQMNRDDGVEENEIVFKLKKYYLLSEEEARNALKRNL